MTSRGEQDAAFDHLLDAWLLWDRYPAAPHVCHTYADALNTYAASINCDPLTLRRYLAHHRRQGLPHDQILTNTRDHSRPDCLAKDAAAA
jgi:hypothetical protein